MMEAFSHLVERAVRGGFLTGFHVEGREGRGVEISHCEAEDDQVTYLCWLLMWFDLYQC